jgi:hypothetical protein
MEASGPRAVRTLAEVREVDAWARRRAEAALVRQASGAAR